MTNLKVYLCVLFLILSGCKGDSDAASSSASPSTGSTTSFIKGKVTNVSGFSDVTLTVTGVASSQSQNKVTSFAAKNVAVDADGNFLIGVEHGCYQLDITKPNYRSRAIDQVCVDTPTKDLGNVGVSVGRRNIMSTTVGSLILMGGGDNSDGYTTTVDILNNTDGSMTIENLSSKRTLGVALSIGNKAYFAGGAQYDNNNTWSTSSIVDIYDTVSKIWTTASLSVGRAELSGGVTDNGYAVFAGGYAGGVVSNVVDIYNSNTDNWTTATLPVARFGMSSVVVGNKIYFAGGATNIGGTTKTTRVDIFDPSTGVWTLKNMSVARRYFPTVKVGNKLMFAGGQTDCFPCDVSNVIDIYDTVLDSWTTSSLSVARELLSATTDGTIAVFAGGSSLATENNVVDIYDSGTDQWTSTTLSEARTNLSVAISGGKALFIGGNTSTTFSNTVDTFDFTTKQIANHLF